MNEFPSIEEVRAVCKISGTVHAYSVYKTRPKNTLLPVTKYITICLGQGPTIWYVVDGTTEKLDTWEQVQEVLKDWKEKP